METRTIGRIIGMAALAAASSAWAHPGHAASEATHFLEHLVPALAVIGLIGYGGLRARLWLERRGASRRRVRS